MPHFSPILREVEDKKEARFRRPENQDLNRVVVAPVVVQMLGNCFMRQEI
jgi:hypothetical protein